VGVLRGEFKIQAMYVDALSEGFRTRVRFPPPPPILKEKALETRGLFYFTSAKFRFPNAFQPTKIFYFINPLPPLPILIDTLFGIQYTPNETEALLWQVNSLRKPPAWTKIRS
jgi:hypothetical protein